MSARAPYKSAKKAHARLNFRYCSLFSLHQPSTGDDFSRPMAQEDALDYKLSVFNLFSELFPEYVSTGDGAGGSAPCIKTRPCMPLLASPSARNHPVHPRMSRLRGRDLAATTWRHSALPARTTRARAPPPTSADTYYVHCNQFFRFFYPLGTCVRARMSARRVTDPRFGIESGARASPAPALSSASLSLSLTRFRSLFPPLSLSPASALSFRLSLSLTQPITIPPSFSLSLAISVPSAQPAARRSPLPLPLPLAPLPSLPLSLAPSLSHSIQFPP